MSLKRKDGSGATQNCGISFSKPTFCYKVSQGIAFGSFTPHYENMPIQIY